MSWLSQFINDPGQFITESPLKALGLLAAPLGAIAAPFLAPEIGAATGLFGAGEAAAGAGAAGAEAAGAGALGFGEAAAGAGAEAGGTSLEALLGGTGGPFEGIAGGGGLSTAGGPGGALAYAPDFNASFDAFGGAAGGAPSPGLPGGAGFGGEAAPFGGVSPADAAAEGSTGAGINAGGGADLTGGGGQSFWDKIVGGAQKSFANNPLGIGLAGAGLGYNMLTGNRTSPEVKAMQGQAAQLNQQQAELMGYLQKGTLPPGLQSAVSSATSAMKARIISNHARNGMSTDPSQNSALAQELNNVDLQAVQLIAQQGVALMNSGLQAAGISSQLYGMLEKINQQQAQSTGIAIANFAAAASGYRPQGTGYNTQVPGGYNSGMGFAA